MGMMPSGLRLVRAGLLVVLVAFHAAAETSAADPTPTRTRTPTRHKEQRDRRRAEGHNPRGQQQRDGNQQAFQAFAAVVSEQLELQLGEIVLVTATFIVLNTLAAPLRHRRWL